MLPSQSEQAHRETYRPLILTLGESKKPVQCSGGHILLLLANRDPPIEAVKNIFVSNANRLQFSDKFDKKRLGVNELTVEELHSLLPPFSDSTPPRLKITDELEKDKDFYLETVALQVEDRVFKVKKSDLLPSTIFSSVDENSISDERPIKLEGVSVADFKALLWVVCEDPTDAKAALSQEAWVSVMRLAVRWSMKNIVETARQKIYLDGLSPVNRVLLGREFDFLNWVESGYMALAMRPEPLSASDFDSLGFSVALELSQKARRKRQLQAAAVGGSPKLDGSKDVGRFLKNELKLDFKEVKELDLVEKALLARKHGVKEWLRASYQELITRKQDINVDEAERLGTDATAFLCRIREMVISQKLTRTAEEVETMIKRLLEKNEGDDNHSALTETPSSASEKTSDSDM